MTLQQSLKFKQTGSPAQELMRRLASKRALKHQLLVHQRKTTLEIIRLGGEIVELESKVRKLG